MNQYVLEIWWQLESGESIIETEHPYVRLEIGDKVNYDMNKDEFNENKDLINHSDLDGCISDQPWFQFNQKKVVHIVTVS